MRTWQGRPIVIVTHDPTVGAEARRIVTMADGRVISDGGRHAIRRRYRFGGVSGVARPHPPGPRRSRQRIALAALMAVLVVALATTGIVGGITARQGAADRWDAVFAEANGAHVTFQFDGSVPDDTLVGDPAVAEASVPFVTALGIRRVIADGSLSDEEFGLAAASADPASVGRPSGRTAHGSPVPATRSCSTAPWHSNGASRPGTG